MEIDTFPKPEDEMLRMMHMGKKKGAGGVFS